jgi:RNA polymerase sigma factor (sigma-70 family)
MNDPLDQLLAQLCGGDNVAAEQVFGAFEPYLRKAVRRQLPAVYRATFDSADIVQSVWADVLRGFREAGWRFNGADHLRGFLFVATRHRLIDRIRRHQQAYPASPRPQPDESAEKRELWDRILARCPPEHRALLHLKRQGYSLAEIAERTCLPPDNVRRILRNLAGQLAFAGEEDS